MAGLWSDELSWVTTSSWSVPQACQGCDLLLHEVYSIKYFQEGKADWQKYLSSFHVSTTQLAAIAAAGKPRQLVLYHQLFRRGDDADAVLLEEMKQAGYKGAVASAHDLDVF